MTTTEKTVEEEIDLRMRKGFSMITITKEQYLAILRGALANYAEDVELAPMYRSLDAVEFPALEKALVELGQIDPEQIDQD